jgi:hypothetical protein
MSEENGFEVLIGGDTKPLTDALEEGIKHLGSFGEMAELAKKMITGPAGLVVAIAGAAVILGELDKEFAGNEKADLLFQAALKGSADQTVAFSRSANEAVETVMRLTGASDETAKAMVGTLVTAGRTRDEIERMTVAAIGLSNASGGTVSVESAMTQLNKTFAGTAIRLVGAKEATADLTAEQLRHGGAVDILYGKYKDMAGVLEDSADVSMKRFTIAQEELKAELGRTVEEGLKPNRDALTAAMDAQTAAMRTTREWTEYIATGGKTNLTDWNATILEATKRLKDMTDVQTVMNMARGGKLVTQEEIKLQRDLLADLQQRLYLETERGIRSEKIAGEEEKQDTILIKNLKFIDEQVTFGILTQEEGFAQKTALREDEIKLILKQAQSEGKITKATSDAVAEQKRVIGLYNVAVIQMNDQKTDALLMGDETYAYSKETIMTQLSDADKAAIAATLARAIAAASRETEATESSVDARTEAIQRLKEVTIFASERSADEIASDLAKSNAAWLEFERTAMLSSDEISKGVTGGVENALMSLGSALAQGHSGWTSLGASAVASMSAVLESIGQELIAIAAADAATGNWAGAIAAGAGATAAFVASGALDAMATGMKEVASSTNAASSAVGKFDTQFLASVQANITQINQLEEEVKYAGYGSYDSYESYMKKISDLARQNRTQALAALSDEMAQIKDSNAYRLKTIKDQQSAEMRAYLDAGLLGTELMDLSAYWNKKYADEQESQRIAALTTADKVAEAYKSLADTIDSQLESIDASSLSFVNSMATVGQDISSALISNLEGGLAESDFMDSMKKYITNIVVQSAVYTDSLKGQMASIGATIAAGVAGGLSEGELTAIKSQLSSLYSTASASASAATSIVNSVFGEDVPKLASGTDNALGGITIVGEQGPELVNMRRGAQVIPASKTRDLLNGANSRAGDVHFHSPIAIDELEASRLLTQTSRQLAFEAQ